MTSLPLRFSAVAGTLYTSAGILGVSQTGLDHLTAPTGPMLWIFRVNGLLSLAHLVAGLACLLAVLLAGSAPQTVTLLAAGAFGVLGILGIAMLGAEGNVLALNTPDTVAHLTTAAIAVAALVVGRPSTISTPPGLEPGTR